ncbi:hypothetical protein FACS189459_5690 [Bacilli bacterium]|nr:hypothetical protein FACS189459_5690 [Bacilli bacterium]
MDLLIFFSGLITLAEIHAHDENPSNENKTAGKQEKIKTGLYFPMSFPPTEKYPLCPFNIAKTIPTKTINIIGTYLTYVRCLDIL